MRRIKHPGSGYMHGSYYGYEVVRFSTKTCINIDSQWWEVDKPSEKITENDIHQMTSKKSFNDLIDLYYENSI